MKKRINKIYSEFDKTKLYSVDEGVDIAINSSSAKFEETIDIAINVNVDPKKSEQNVRGKIQLPKSLGKTIKVCVFACLLYTSPSPRDKRQSRMPSSA